MCCSLYWYYVTFSIERGIKTRLFFNLWLDENLITFRVNLHFQGMSVWMFAANSFRCLNNFCLLHSSAPSSPRKRATLNMFLDIYRIKLGKVYFCMDTSIAKLLSIKIFSKLSNAGIQIEHHNLFENGKAPMAQLAERTLNSCKL